MGFTAQGTLLYWGDTTAYSTASTNSVGEVKSFSGPSGSANIIDDSHLGSTSKEKRMGLPDEGQITLEVLLNTTDPAQIKLRTDRAARTKKSFIIKLSDSTVAGSETRVKGKGYCTGFAISGAVDDAVKASVTIEITGGVSWSTAAP